MVGPVQIDLDVRRGAVICLVRPVLRSTHPVSALSLSFNAVIGRMIHNLATPEINMVGVFRMYTHAQYLPLQYQSSLADLLNQNSRGKAFLDRYDPFSSSAAAASAVATTPRLLASSRRGAISLTGSEYAQIRILARRAISDYDGVCTSYENSAVTGSKVPLASSSDLGKWAMLQDMSAYGVKLANGPSPTVDRFLSAEVNRAKFGSAEREVKRSVSRSRNSGFAMSGAQLGRQDLFGVCSDFLDCSFAGHDLFVARVALYETLGREARSQLHRISTAQKLQGVQFEFVLISDFLGAVAFAEQDAATKRCWVLDCSRG